MVRRGRWLWTWWTVGTLFSVSDGALAAQELSAKRPSEGIFTAKSTVLLMGSRFDFGAYAKTQPAADTAVARAIAEVERIEALISSWQPTSQTSAINAAAGSGVPCPGRPRVTRAHPPRTTRERPHRRRLRLDGRRARGAVPLRRAGHRTAGARGFGESPTAR